MNTAADLTSLEFDESFDTFDSIESDFDLAWSPQNSDAQVTDSDAQPSSTRVRFTASASLTSTALGVHGEGMVTNLSPRGLSLSTELDLDPGTRVTLGIALGFAADDLIVESEVLWRRYREHGETVYGLSFCEPSPKVYDEVHRLIEERCEGRVLEWELPWIPEQESKAERFSWRALTLGIAIGLAGALGMLRLTEGVEPGVTLTESPKGMKAFGSEPKATAVAPVEVDRVPTDAPVVETTQPAPKTAVVPSPKTPSASKDEATRVAEPSEAAPVKRPVRVQAPPSVKKEPAAEPKVELVESLTDDASALEALAPAWETTELGLALRIPLDQGGEGVKWFALSDPSRLVVDVLNGTTPLAEKSYRVGEGSIEGMRIGRYDSKTRFVFDVAENVTFVGDPQLTPSGDWVTMTFRK